MLSDAAWLMQCTSQFCKAHGNSSCQVELAKMFDLLR